MAKEPYGNNKCEICGSQLLKENWGMFGDLIEIRITCEKVTCKFEPHLTTELKEEDDIQDASD